MYNVLYMQFINRLPQGCCNNCDFCCCDSMADRSTNDLTQYPVFPWIVADYTSKTLGKQTWLSHFKALSQNHATTSHNHFISLKII